MKTENTLSDVIYKLIESILFEARPKGSKNKPKEDTQQPASEITPKKRGRPKGPPKSQKEKKQRGRPLGTTGIKHDETDIRLAKANIPTVLDLDNNIPDEFYDVYSSTTNESGHIGSDIISDVVKYLLSQAYIIIRNKLTMENPSISSFFDPADNTRVIRISTQKIEEVFKIPFEQYKNYALDFIHDIYSLVFNKIRYERFLKTGETKETIFDKYKKEFILNTVYYFDATQLLKRYGTTDLKFFRPDDQVKDQIHILNDPKYTNNPEIRNNNYLYTHDLVGINALQDINDISEIFKFRDAFNKIVAIYLIAQKYDELMKYEVKTKEENQSEQNQTSVYTAITAYKSLILDSFVKIFNKAKKQYDDVASKYTGPEGLKIVGNSLDSEIGVYSKLVRNSYHSTSISPDDIKKIGSQIYKEVVENINNTNLLKLEKEYPLEIFSSAGITTVDELLKKAFDLMISNKDIYTQFIQLIQIKYLLDNIQEWTAKQQPISRKQAADQEQPINPYSPDEIDNT